MIINIAILILALSISVGLFIFLWILNKYLKNKLEAEDRRFNLSMKINDERFDLLDKIITKEIDTYGKIHPDKFSVDGNSYIREDDFKDILAEITANIIRNITPVIKENIKLVYNFNNDSELVNIIGNKAGLILAVLASEINSAIIEDTPIIETTDLEL